MLPRMVHDVLVVEDEEDIAVPLMRTLEREGYDVSRVSGGAEAVAFVVGEAPAVVILDLGLPDMDGIDVCRQMRAARLHRRHHHGDRPRRRARPGGRPRRRRRRLPRQALRPRRAARPRARAAASQRHRRDSDTTVTTASGLKIDAASRRVHLGDREIALTAKEFDVLAVLASHHDKVVPRETLMNQVWDQNWYGSTKTLDVTIGRLRSKLEAAEAGERVVAIRGVGFRLETGTAA